VKSLNRNASLDADAAYFNPAGTAMMEKGLYLYVSYQCILQPITLETQSLERTAPSTATIDPNNKSYDVSQDAYYFPNLYLVYNNWNMAFSLGLMAIGGGGGGYYNDGFPMVENTAAFMASSGTGIGIGTLLDFANLLKPGEDAATVDTNYGNLTGDYAVDGNLEASEAFYSFQVNYAYMPIKQIAFSAGYRFAYGYNTYKGKFKIDLEGTNDTYRLTEEIDAVQQGMCHAVIGGVSVAPLAGINDAGSLIVAGRFEWNSEFILKTKADKETILAPEFSDGARSYRTLPMVMAIGVSYSIIGIHLDAGLTYYFNKNAYWNGNEDDYENGFETGLGISYDVLSKKNYCENLNIGVGYNYGTDGENDDTRSDTHIGLTWHAVGAGATWEIIKDLKLTVAYCFSYFVPDTYNETLDFDPFIGTYESEATKYIHDIAIGLQYKIL